MKSSRHLIDDKVWERIMFAAKAHGYSKKGKKSWQKFVLELVEDSLKIPVKMADHSFDAERYALTTTILKLERELKRLKESSHTPDE